MVGPGDGEFVVAGLLDIPFVFDLILHGSFYGSFSDSYLRRKGYFSILALLLSSLQCSSWLFKNRNRQLLLFVKQGVPVGFIQIESTNGDQGMPMKYIITCAIAPEFRGHRFGREMIALLIAHSTTGTEICGVCTKYARAMHATFKSLHFTRKSVGFSLDHYSYITSRREDVSTAGVEPLDKASDRYRHPHEAAIFHQRIFIKPTDR